MKKLLILLSLTILFPACGLVDESVGIYEDGKESVGNIVDEFNETKDKIEETADDIGNAVEKVEEAKNAISEITE